ncbi:TPA: CopG family transcriptional regulator [Candidatus Bipolaricaulota bacterium]|nr:CopG family transcriptional regulator [Candidatus Bipolaricaulota bacterium]
MGDERREAVLIHGEIVRAIETHLAELGADSVEEYVEAVLREKLLAAGILSPYSREEEREVEKRLRDLGYLD